MAGAWRVTGEKLGSRCGHLSKTWWSGESARGWREKGRNGWSHNRRSSWEEGG